MLKEILVQWETFNFKVWCVIGLHRYLPAYVKKRHQRIYRDRSAADVRGLYFKNKPCRGGILWLPKVPRSADEIGYLAHEMGHAVMDMHSQRGLNLDTLNDETFCYAIAHGVSEVLRECKK